MNLNNLMKFFPNRELSDDEDKSSSGCGGFIFGIILFLSSFWVLWWNEGRVDFSKILKKSEQIKNITPYIENKFISYTSEIHSKEKLNDPDFLKEINYIVLKRIVQMYAWKKKTRRVKKGSRRVRETYYKEEWTSSPDYIESDTYKNPPMKYKNKTFKVNTATLGNLKINPHEIIFRGLTDIHLTKDILSPNPKEKISIYDKYLFIGKGTLNSPMIGDLRIKYVGIKDGTLMTGFGKVKNNALIPYYYKDGKKTFKIYHIYKGTREDAFILEHREYKILLWLFRGLGFLMMWIGLSALFSPLTTLLSFIPIVGDIGIASIGCITFIVALILSILTIIISIIAHNPILLIIVISGLLTFAFIIMKNKWKKEEIES